MHSARRYAEPLGNLRHGVAGDAHDDRYAVVVRRHGLQGAGHQVLDTRDPGRVVTVVFLFGRASTACSSPGPDRWMVTAVRLLRFPDARGVGSSRSTVAVSPGWPEESCWFGLPARASVASGVGSSRTATDSGIPIPLPLIRRSR